MHKENLIMDKETKDIVKLIASIQIESLNSIKEDVKNGNDIAQDLIKKLLQIEDDEIIRALDEHIELYVEMENTPSTDKYAKWIPNAGMLSHIVQNGRWMGTY